MKKFASAGWRIGEFFHLRRADKPNSVPIPHMALK